MSAGWYREIDRVLWIDLVPTKDRGARGGHELLCTYIFELDNTKQHVHAAFESFVASLTVSVFAHTRTDTASIVNLGISGHPLLPCTRCAGGVVFRGDEHDGTQTKMSEEPGGLSTRYWGSFALTTLLCVALQYYSRNQQNGIKNARGSEAMTARFATFQRNYLAVFLLAMFSDWLQGPYVYELYVSYGFDKGQISELFVCGFGSSMIVGTFVGGLADKLGRKNMCILYSVCYVVACMTKLVPEYWTLMLGRFLSGVSTSLLFSVFESWMVCEHHKQGFDSTLLGDTFAYATFGNGLVAVGAGLVANSAADKYGYVAPFVVAIFPLTAVALLVMFSWTENYGNQQLNALSSLQKGFELITSDSRIAALGMAQSCYEGIFCRSSNFAY